MLPHRGVKVTPCNYTKWKLLDTSHLKFTKVQRGNAYTLPNYITSPASTFNQEGFKYGFEIF